MQPNKPAIAGATGESFYVIASGGAIRHIVWRDALLR